MQDDYSLMQDVQSIHSLKMISSFMHAKRSVHSLIININAKRSVHSLMQNDQFNTHARQSVHSLMQDDQFIHSCKMNTSFTHAGRSVHSHMQDDQFIHSRKTIIHSCKLIIHSCKTITSFTHARPWHPALKSWLSLSASCTSVHAA